MPDRYMDVKDFSETVSVRLTEVQAERLKAHADARGVSQSDLIRYWIENGDLIPQIPPKVVSKLRYIAWGQKRDARRLIEDVLRREWEGRLGWR